MEFIIIFSILYTKWYSSEGFVTSAASGYLIRATCTSFIFPTPGNSIRSAYSSSDFPMGVSFARTAFTTLKFVVLFKSINRSVLQFPFFGLERQCSILTPTIVLNIPDTFKGPTGF